MRSWRCWDRIPLAFTTFIHLILSSLLLAPTPPCGGVPIPTFSWPPNILHALTLISLPVALLPRSHQTHKRLKELKVQYSPRPQPCTRVSQTPRGIWSSMLRVSLHTSLSQKAITITILESHKHVIRVHHSCLIDIHSISCKSLFIKFLLDPFLLY